MLTILFTLIFFFLTITPVFPALVPILPNCSFGNGIDADGNGLVDTGCDSMADNFVATATGYAVDVKDCSLSGNVETFADALASSGQAVRNIAQSNQFSGWILCRATLPSGTYSLKVNGESFNAGHSFFWLSTTPSNIHPVPPNTLRHQLFGGNTQLTYGWSNTDVTIVATTAVQLSLFIALEDSIVFSCLYLDTNTLVSPQCPTGNTAPTPDYVMLKSSSAPTSCTNFTFANAIALNGANTSGYIDSAPIFKFIHFGNKIYFCGVKVDQDLKATNVTADVLANNDDQFEINWCENCSGTIRDATSFKFACNILGTKYSANYPGNVVNPAFSLSEICTPTLTGDVDGVADDTTSQWFGSVDAGFTVIDDSFIRLELSIKDADASDPNKNRYGCGASGNTPSTWCLVQLSSTLVPASIDSINPSVAALSFSSVTSSGMTVQSSSITDTGGASCCTVNVKWGTVTDTYNNYPNGPLPVTLTGTTGTIGLTSLLASTNYRVRFRVCDGQGNCTDSAEGSQTTIASSSGTHFVSSSGSGNCTSGNPCLFNNVWLASRGAHRNVVAGDTIIAADGVYTGPNSMLTPPLNLNGTPTNRITVKALNDGNVRIDGGGVNYPIALKDNDYFTIEGFNAHNSNGAVVGLGSGADNNIVRRVVAWDAKIGNYMCFGTNDNTGNLLEDVAAFGSCRKNIQWYRTPSNPTPTEKFTVRRAWAQWNKNQTLSTEHDGPNMSFSVAYNTYGGLFENIIGTWDNEGTGFSNEPFGLLSADGFTGTGGHVFPDRCTNAKMIGSIGYLITANIVQPSWPGALFSSGSMDCTNVNDIVLVNQSGHTTLRSGRAQSASSSSNPSNCGTSCSRSWANITVINWPGGMDIQNEDASNGTDTTNIQSYTDSTAANTAGANPWQSTAGIGARVCFRTIDGKLTNTKLWPWPMDTRIAAALNTSGRSATAILGATSTVTGRIESLLGTIPGTCK